MKKVVLSIWGVITCATSYADSVEPETLPLAPPVVSATNASSVMLEITWSQLLVAHGRGLQSNWTKDHYSLWEHDLFEEINAPQVIASGLNVLTARDFTGMQIEKITLVTDDEKNKTKEEEQERKRNKGGHREP